MARWTYTVNIKGNVVRSQTYFLNRERAYDAAHRIAATERGAGKRVINVSVHHYRKVAKHG